MKIGTKVRFTRGPLGASERNKLGCVVDETFNAGDEGVVVFQHPNAKNKHFSKDMRRSLAKTWYVEVQSKTHPGKKLFVGEHEEHLAVIDCMEPI